MAFKLGDLFWKIKGDTQDIDKKLGETDESVQGTSTKFGKLQGIISKAAPWVAAGAAAIALAKKIFSLGVDAGEAADKLLDLTEITGLNTDTLQELQFIAADTGVNFDGLTGAVQRFSAKIPDLEGTSNVADAFNSLGVNLRDSNGEIRDSNELFPDMIKALQNVENTTERNSIAQQLFGRSLQDLAPVLGLTNDEFDNLRQTAQDTGAVIGEDALTSANEFRASLDAAKLSVSQAKLALGSEFAPILEEVVIPIVTTAANLITSIASGIRGIKEAISEFTALRDAQKAVEEGNATIQQRILLLQNEKASYEKLADQAASSAEALGLSGDAAAAGYMRQAEATQRQIERLELQWEKQEQIRLKNEQSADERTPQQEDEIALTEDLIDLTDDQADATEEVAKMIQFTQGEAIVPMTEAAREMWRVYGEGAIAAVESTQEWYENLLNVDTLATDFIGSTLSGFQAVGDAIYNNADAAAVLGAAVLESVSQILVALGSELAARAAIEALSERWDKFAIAAAASAAAFTAAGVVSAAASDISSQAQPSSSAATTSTTTPSGSSGSTGTTTPTTSGSRGSGSTYNITINNLISTGKEADIRAAVRAQAPFIVEELVNRGDI